MGSNEIKRKPSNNEFTDEQTIGDYLKEHPDFFTRHPELLADLALPDVGGEQVVSLAERQVAVLRSKNESLEGNFEALLARAKENESLETRVHAVAVAAVAVATIEEAFASMPALIREQFGIAHAIIRLGPRPAYAAQSTDDDIEVDIALSRIIERVAHRRSVCDDRLPHATLDYLFGDRVGSVDSCALIPLVDRGEHVLGVLALGAGDVKRFQPNLGTVFLDRLGLLLGAVFERLYRVEAGR